jgi:hypothetical protein
MRNVCALMYMESPYTLISYGRCTVTGPAVYQDTIISCCSLAELSFRTSDHEIYNSAVYAAFTNKLWRVTYSVSLDAESI